MKVSPGQLKEFRKRADDEGSGQCGMRGDELEGLLDYIADLEKQVEQLTTALQREAR